MEAMEGCQLNFGIHVLNMADVHVQAMGRRKGSKPRHPYFQKMDQRCSA
jgi:hypothetical protein